jgi:acyl carrier protein
VLESREEYLDSNFVPPANALESTVAEIQAEILGIDRLGRTDSFFDFGGTSLQAVRICARIEKQTGHRVVPAWLFVHDVLADFVARVERGDVESDGE